MALSAGSMADKIEARLNAISFEQFEGGAAGLDARRRAYLEAFCQGIIDEITANAVVTTTSGAPDGEHTGEVS